MIDPSSPIGLDEFEAVEAGRGTALLRILARPPKGPGSRTKPVLLIDDEARRHRIEPLPSPPEPRGMLRLAYSAPLEVLERHCSFTLEIEPGILLELPPPNRRTTAPPRRGRLLEPRAKSSDQVADALEEEGLEERRRGDDAVGLAEAGQRTIADLESRLQRERERRAEAEAQLARRIAVQEEELAKRDAALSELHERLNHADLALAAARQDAASHSSELQRSLEEAGRAAEAEGRRADEANAHMRMLEHQTALLRREAEERNPAEPV